MWFLHEFSNICNPEEGWYGQPKYCYEKAIHVVLNQLCSSLWTSLWFHNFWCGFVNVATYRIRSRGRVCSKYLQFFKSFYPPPQSTVAKNRLIVINLLFVGPFLTRFVQRKIRRLTQRFRKNIDIKLVFFHHKLKNLFSVKDTTTVLYPSHYHPM